MSLYLALDIGRRTGWAVVEHGTILYSGSFSIERIGREAGASPILIDAWQAGRLASQVEALVADYDPHVLAIEQVFVADHRSIANRKLLLLRGAALAGAMRAKPEIMVIEAPIRSWQAWAAGALNWRKKSGRAGDEADARAIALWAAAQENRS